MPGSLRNTCKFSLWERIESNVRAQLNSSVSKKTVYIFVEGETDMEFYNRFLWCQVLPSKLDEKTGNCQKVLKIVSYLINYDASANVFGIIDSDCLPFTKFKCPPNVFMTDHRDMETTCISVEHVRNSINAIFPNVISHKREIYDVAYYVGMLRIACFKYAKSCNLNGSINLHTVYAHIRWRDMVDVMLKTEIYRVYGKKEKARIFRVVKKFIVRFQSLRKDFYDVARGHDLVLLMQYWSGGALQWKGISKFYTSQDFRESDLGRKLRMEFDMRGLNNILLP